jgi:hypothetical protein
MKGYTHKHVNTFLKENMIHKTQKDIKITYVSQKKKKKTTMQTYPSLLTPHQEVLVSQELSRNQSQHKGNPL